MIFKKLPVLALLLGLGLALIPGYVSAQGPDMASKTSTGEFVEFYFNGQQVVVHLISQAADMAGITVRVVDMGTLIGVETFDPAGRYLPAVNILPKSAEGRLILSLPQTPRTDRYRLRAIGSANVAPFWTSFVGATSPEQLHTLLATQYSSQNGLNLLWAINEPLGELAVYRTPLPATVLVVPTSLLPDPLNPQNLVSLLDVPALVLMQVADLAQSPYDYLNKARAAQVPNLFGLSTLKFGVTDALDLATAPLGFRYAITLTACANQFGAVIQQTPLAGAAINPFGDTIQITVCEPFLRANGQNKVIGYVRYAPMLASSSITRSIPTGTALTVIGRTANNTWLQLLLPDGSQGWLSSQSVQLDRDVNALQVVDIPYGAFLADQTQITAGQCVTISWRVENVIQVFYGRSAKPFSGSALECPPSPGTYVLRVIGNDRQAYQFLLTIQVIRWGY